MKNTYFGIDISNEKFNLYYRDELKIIWRKKVQTM